MLIDLSAVSQQYKTPSNDFETKVLDFLKEWFSATKTVKVKTSGSTGTPKIFDVEKSKMINSAEMTCDFLGLAKGNLALLCLPVEYISGKMMIVRSIIKNMLLLTAPPSLSPLEDIEEMIDFCAMTPLQVENSLEKIHRIKNLIIGGAAVSETLKKKINLSLEHAQQTPNIYETYGMSETLSHIALKKIYPDPEDWFSVFDGVNISVDARGCLKIVAPSLNSEVLQTNDLVEIKNEKQFRFLGRIDNIINSGGAKISPETLEMSVKKNIPNELVFVGIEDEKLGQKLVLVIEGKQSDAINQQLSQVDYEKSFHKPKDVIFVDSIPRTENGKVNRNQLNQMLNEMAKHPQ